MASEVETAAQALRQVGIPESCTSVLTAGFLWSATVVIARVLAKPHRYPADEPTPTLTQNVVGDYAAVIPAEQEFGKTLVTSLHAFEYARSHYQRIVLASRAYFV